MEPPRKFGLQSSLLEKRAERRTQIDCTSAVACGHNKHRIAIDPAVLVRAVLMRAVIVCAVIAVIMIVLSPETLFAQTPTASPTPAPAAPAEPAPAPGRPRRTRWGNPRRVRDSPVHRTGLPDYRLDRQRRYVRHPGESSDWPANT